MQEWGGPGPHFKGSEGARAPCSEAHEYNTVVRNKAMKKQT